MLLIAYNRNKRFLKWIYSACGWCNNWKYCTANWKGNYSNLNDYVLNVEHGFQSLILFSILPLFWVVLFLFLLLLSFLPWYFYDSDFWLAPCITSLMKLITLIRQIVCNNFTYFITLKHAIWVKRPQFNNKFSTSSWQVSLDCRKFWRWKDLIGLSKILREPFIC